MDCAFSVVHKNGKQYSFFGSRRAPADRTELQVGPFRLEILEPMRSARVVLEENASGLSCDLVFSTRTSAIQEGRQTLWLGVRRIMDCTRVDQFGRWTGVLRSPEGTIAVTEDTCLGIKDRSWGARPVGERETGGAPDMPAGTFFAWVPLAWDDHISHAIFFDNMAGEPLVREALTAPLYATAEAVPGVEDGRIRRLATAQHRIGYAPGTRLPNHVELGLRDHDDSVRRITLEPLLTFHMKGLGYNHPQWGYGMWKGEMALGHESFDPRELDLLDYPNMHTQQVVRAREGDRVATGVLEHVCIGAYAPGGFKEYFDGAAA